MKKCTALLLALLAALSLTACGQTEDTGDTEWEYPAAFAGLETLVEQAQAEGSLTVYGGCPAEYLTAAHGGDAAAHAGKGGEKLFRKAGAVAEALRPQRGQRGNVIAAVFAQFKIAHSAASPHFQHAVYFFSMNSGL